MYFSKNSRYVLLKAQALSPTLLKATERNLSVKTPSDDPSKPPLRINIPKEPSQEENYKGHNVERRSSSFTSGPLMPPIASSFEEDLLQKCESEMHFPNFDDMIMDKTSSLNYVGNKEGYVNGLRTPLQEEETANALGSIAVDKEPLMTAGAKSTIEANPKSVYIIIDVPVKTDEKFQASKEDMVNEPKKLFFEEGDTEKGDTISMDLKKRKVDRAKAGLYRVSKSLPKFPKLERTRRFEIDEIEDAGTYVFHFNLYGKGGNPSKLGIVPEKEVSVRNENSNAGDVPIRVSDSSFTTAGNPRMKQVTNLDEFPGVFKYQSPSMKYNSPKNEESAFPQEDSTGDDVEASQRFMQHPPKHREWRSPVQFERDDFGTVRTPKNYPFRLPVKAKPEDSQSPEEEAQSCAPSAVEGEYPPAQVGTVQPESPYLNISEVNGTAENTKAEEGTATPEPVENSPSYYNIAELKKEKTIDKTKVDDQINQKKEFSGEVTKIDREALNFQTCVSIESERVCCKPTKFSAAFPPLLSDALKTRFQFRKPSFLVEKLGASLKGSKSLEDCCKSSKVAELLENSILFPKKEKFDCESLFTTREEVITKIIDNSEREKASEEAKKPAKPPKKGPTEKLYSDSLNIMKKVKEIVQFDLDNVVKIFNSEEEKEVSSVIISAGDGWKIDSEELTRQFQKAALRLRNLEEKKDVPEGVVGGKVDGKSQPAPTKPKKYLPTRRENPSEMKLSDEDSVVTYDPDTNELSIKKDALAEAIARKTNEPISEVSLTLGLLAKTTTKSGDSILVFDDETQSWKVDFSILERREEQMKIEEELTKRSEMILETFEKLEKDQIPNIPLPDTREKKTFDYKNGQWNTYNSDKKRGKEKSKSPFRESDAEEIRKQNSDLYDNLFIANKENNTKADKSAPGKNPSKLPKKTQAYLLSDCNDKPGSDSSKSDSGSSQKDKSNPDDNFWGSFLDLNILPRDIKDIPKTPPPSSGTSTAPPTPPATAPKTDVIETPKKIDDSKFKIRLPFIKDKKNDKEEAPGPKANPKVDPVKQLPTDSPGPSPGKSEKPGVQVPPGPSQRKQVPPAKKPPPTIGSSKTSEEVKKAPGSSKPDMKDPKSGGKPEKSATDHYVSDKIIEISRNKPTDGQPKIKANKIETVKLTITSDTRLPSKVTEINLSKKAEEKTKETTASPKNPVDAKTPSDSPVKKTDQPVENKKFQKSLEKYKSPYSEPDYEEKPQKIKSDMESNPNLKKLDNWSKTLVLHDIMKPPENIESWLKDETDKMATLLLKVLQEAADGKPKKKQPLSKNKNEKQVGKANPYDNIRKKQETTPENILFRVRTVNVSLENKKKQGEKLTVKPEQLKDVTAQSEKAGKPPKVADSTKTLEKEVQVPVSLEDPKVKVPQTVLETSLESVVMSKELSQAKMPMEITEEIPGPEILKKISNTWKMFPVLGSQMTIFTLLRVFQLVNLGSSILGSTNPDKTRRYAFTKLFLKYGPIVNVQGPLSGNVILIHAPEHLTGVFDQDITTSVRSVFDSLEQSRRETEENGAPVGPGISTDWSKPEWSDLKRETVDPLLRGSAKYLSLSDAAGEFLVNNVRRNRNPQNFVSEDFMEDIRRWSLEGLCSVIFEKSFGFLEGRTNSESWLLEPDKLYLAIDEATACLSKCERGFQMWRLMSTPSTVGLGRAYRSISSILAKQLYQAELNLKSKAELMRSETSVPVRDLTFVEGMLLNDGMTTDEITCNLVDMILIGTNLMNSAMGFLLYNLAQNVKVQMKLLRELKEVLPNKDSPLNHNQINSLKYLQACLKETLRLNFPVPVFYRLLQNDILLANYIVPKGTFVVMDYRVSSMKEQVFDDPDKFIPERWLTEEQWLQGSHPFGAFPLCHGPRADLAKRVVELQLLTCAAKLIRNFQVEYQFGEIQGTDAIISVPDKPLKLNFLEREL